MICQSLLEPTSPAHTHTHIYITTPFSPYPNEFDCFSLFSSISLSSWGGLRYGWLFHYFSVNPVYFCDLIVILIFCLFIFYQPQLSGVFLNFCFSRSFYVLCVWDFVDELFRNVGVSTCLLGSGFRNQEAAFNDIFLIF